MSSLQREDDFERRRQHLEGLSDDELHARFWRLAEQLVKPLVEEARIHTTPSIERSVLLRMGFSSLESRALVEKLSEKALLGHGAGRLILQLALNKGIPVRDAGTALLGGRYWEDLR